MAHLQEYWNNSYFRQYRPKFYKAFCDEVAFQKYRNPGLSDSRIRRIAIKALEHNMLKVFKELGRVIVV